MRLHGGEAETIVEMDGSFSDVSVAPDGTRVLCTFRPADPPDGKAEEDQLRDRQGDDPREKAAPVFRHVDRLFYRLDGTGFLPQAEGQVWVFDLESGQGTQLTREKNGAANPAFSPDGRHVVYVTNRERNPDLDMHLGQLVVMAATGGKARVLDAPPGPKSLPAFSPDGTRIAYIGHDDVENPWYEPGRVWTVAARGKGTARCVCPRFAHSAADVTGSDCGEGFFELQPRWSRDGRWLHFISCHEGATVLYRVRARGGDPECLTPGKHHLQSVDVSDDGSLAVGVLSTPVRPPEVATFDLATGEMAWATEFHHDWLREIAVQRPKEVRVRSADGTRVHGWILTPPGAPKRRKHPAIIEVHGGPMTQYGFSFFHELQMLAAAGYVVGYANPRGSMGYGREFAEAIKADWGNLDFADVMAFTDRVAEEPGVDASRIGITGGSYGGYMTNWAVGHTRRFKAAVTQRCVSDLVPFFGSSDVGYLFPRTFGDVPWKARERYEAMSPLTYAPRIRTPLLIIHSENDLRCGIEQAENLYATLKVLKRKVEMVRFPEESHGLSRGGRPDRRLVRLERILEWFERHL
jgi:dipeptidyl aminopeptidase/acylaminoacyl peptidase